MAKKRTAWPVAVSYPPTPRPGRWLWQTGSFDIPGGSNPWRATWSMDRARPHRREAGHFIRRTLGELGLDRYRWYAL